MLLLFTRSMYVYLEHTANLRMNVSFILDGVMWILLASLILLLSASFLSLSPRSLKQTSPILAGTGSSNLRTNQSSVLSVSANQKPGAQTSNQPRLSPRTARRARPGSWCAASAPPRHRSSSRTRAWGSGTSGPGECASAGSQGSHPGACAGDTAVQHWKHPQFV